MGTDRIGKFMPALSGNSSFHADTVSDSPNTRRVREFIQQAAPDLMIARCKFILKERDLHDPQRMAPL